MKVLCVGSRGSDLPQETLRGSGNRPEAMFPVVVGTEYMVRAMGLWTTHLSVMVVGRHGWPIWLPVELFVVVDHEVPAWEFAVGVSGFRALWGYPTLVRDPKHNEDLSDRRKGAREAFMRESGVIGFDQETKRFVE